MAGLRELRHADGWCARTAHTPESALTSPPAPQREVPTPPAGRPAQSSVFAREPPPTAELKVATRRRGLPAGAVWHRAWNDLAARGVVPAVALRRSAAGAAYRAAKCASLACSWAMVCGPLAGALAFGCEDAAQASDRRLAGSTQEQVEGTVVRYMAIIRRDPSLVRRPL